jgi:methionyl-tRNA formyltransferase
VRVAVLTSRDRHFGSVAVPALANAADIDVALVIHNTGEGARPRGSLRKKLRKMLLIGPLGALNGIRMRPWFGEHVTERLNIEPIETVCSRHGIRLERTPRLNGKHTRKLLRESGAELGLSVGNGWIGPKLFGTPPRGMLNVHHEVLPRYRGALPVVWQIHDGSTETGYTIHAIDRSIDTGAILFQERLPIEFQADLAATASHNYARLLQASADGLVQTIRRFDELVATAGPQGPGQSYTTPTFRQYRRMVREHRRLAGGVQRPGA